MYLLVWVCSKYGALIWHHFLVPLGVASMGNYKFMYLQIMSEQEPTAKRLRRVILLIWSVGQHTIQQSTSEGLRKFPETDELLNVKYVMKYLLKYR